MGSLIFAIALLPRPVLSGAEATADCGVAFKVHYTLAGADALANGATDVQPKNGTPDDVDAVAAGVTKVFDHWVTGAGMRAPLPDGNLGGDGRIDVYVRKLDGPRGYTQSEEVGMAPAESAWIELDPRTALMSESRLSAAAGHEAHHAIQYAYSASIDVWMQEATATYVENTDFTGLQDETKAHYARVFAHPETPLDTANGTHEYDEMAFVAFLLDGTAEATLGALFVAMVEGRSTLAGIKAVRNDEDAAITLVAFARWLESNRAVGMHLPVTASFGHDLIGLPQLSVRRLTASGCTGTVQLRDATGTAYAFVGPAILTQGDSAQIPNGEFLIARGGLGPATIIVTGMQGCDFVEMGVPATDMQRDLAGSDQAGSGARGGCGCRLGDRRSGGDAAWIVFAVALATHRRRRSCRAARRGDPARRSPV